MRENVERIVKEIMTESPLRQRLAQAEAKCEETKQLLVELGQAHEKVKEDRNTLRSELREARRLLAEKDSRWWNRLPLVNSVGKLQKLNAWMKELERRVESQTAN